MIIASAPHSSYSERNVVSICDYIAEKQRSPNDDTNHSRNDLDNAIYHNRSYSELCKIINSICILSVPLPHPSSASNLARLTRSTRLTGRYRTCCTYVMLHVAWRIDLWRRIRGTAREDTHKHL